MYSSAAIHSIVATLPIAKIIFRKTKILVVASLNENFVKVFSAKFWYLIIKIRSKNSKAKVIVTEIAAPID